MCSTDKHPLAIFAAQIRRNVDAYWRAKEKNCRLFIEEDMTTTTNEITMPWTVHELIAADCQQDVALNLSRDACDKLFPRAAHITARYFATIESLEYGLAALKATDSDVRGREIKRPRDEGILLQEWLRTTGTAPDDKIGAKGITGRGIVHMDESGGERQLKAIDMVFTRWIPAKEPPAMDGEFLVSDGTRIGIAQYRAADDPRRTRTGWWGARIRFDAMNETVHCSSVTHWMPLPEPPK